MSSPWETTTGSGIKAILCVRVMSPFKCVTRKQEMERQVLPQSCLMCSKMAQMDEASKRIKHKFPTSSFLHRCPSPPRSISGLSTTKHFCSDTLSFWFMMFFLYTAEHLNPPPPLSLEHIQCVHSQQSSAPVRSQCYQDIHLTFYWPSCAQKYIFTSEGLGLS